MDYKWGTFTSDLIAGLTVAFVRLPQGMAYALLATLWVSILLTVCNGASEFGWNEFASVFDDWPNPAKEALKAP